MLFTNVHDNLVYKGRQFFNNNNNNIQKLNDLVSKSLPLNTLECSNTLHSS